MKVAVQPGRYVVAVSGGVDSVVLLDVLARQPGVQLVVAHFDHGIRPESAQDAAFVAKLAAGYGLAFISQRAELGPTASEDVARRARYAFLRRTAKEQGARAVITAHHQDDLLETAIFNLLRGTGRRGLTSLHSTAQLVRPLLAVSKADILAYARQRNLSWREDSTNHDDRYARNYIRHRLLVRFDASARQRLLTIITQLQAVNEQLDAELAQLVSDLSYVCGDSTQDLHKHKSAAQPANRLPREAFVQLPHTVSKEIMAAWLRQNGINDYDRKTLERLVVQAKTKPPGKQLDVRHGWYIAIAQEALALRRPER